VSRIYRVLGIASPPAAAAAVIVAGSLTPGYDAMSRTVSRLAVPGVWAAAVVDMSIALVAVTCFALALNLGPNLLAGRIALSVSGVALGGAAIVHLDPGSAGATALHHSFSAIAVLGLTAAPLILARAYGSLSLVIGVAELGMLVIGLALLATPFDAWGAWERVLLAIPLAWMVLLSARLRPTAAMIPSTEEIISANTATLSRSGS
jgi:hypothetical protein